MSSAQKEFTRDEKTLKIYFASLSLTDEFSITELQLLLITKWRLKYGSIIFQHFSLHYLLCGIHGPVIGNSSPGEMLARQVFTHSLISRVSFWIYGQTKQRFGYMQLIGWIQSDADWCLRSCWNLLMGEGKENCFIYSLDTELLLCRVRYW